MSVWFDHVAHLIGHSFMRWVVFLGTSPGGIAAQVVVLLLTEVQGGWWKFNTWVENWKGGLRRAVFALGSVWAIVFIVCVVATIYNDHVGLVAQISAREVRLQSESMQIQKLQTALKDQKPLIKYLSEKNKPLDMFVSATLLAKVGSADPSRKLFILVAVTNQNISPVDVSLTCNYDFIVTEQPMVASREEMIMYFMTKVDQISGNKIIYKMQSPAWGPQNPMEIPILVNGFDSNKPLKCEIKKPTQGFLTKPSN
jgi:hypothetical protein